MKNQLCRMTQKVWKCRYIIGITLILVVGVHSLNPSKPISNPKTTFIVLAGGLIASTRLQLLNTRVS